MRETIHSPAQRGNSIGLPLAALALHLLLSACAMAPRPDSEWPDGIPPRDYFIERYRSDAANHDLQSEREYLTWVRRFYEGWEIYPFGWLDMQKDVIGLIAADQADAALEKLRNAGRIIATDWARHNTIHRITTKLLALWGEVIEVALGDGKADAAIELITEDAQDLVEGETKPENYDPVYYESRLGIYMEELF